MAARRPERVWTVDGVRVRILDVTPDTADGRADLRARISRALEVGRGAEHGGTLGASWRWERLAPAAVLDDCFAPEDAEHGPACGYRQRSGARCTAPAVWHVNYGTGCGTLCGVHRRPIVRLRPAAIVRPANPPTPEA